MMACLLLLFSCYRYIRFTASTSETACQQTDTWLGWCHALQVTSHNLLIGSLSKLFFVSVSLVSLTSNATRLHSALSVVLAVFPSNGAGNPCVSTTSLINVNFRVLAATASALSTLFHGGKRLNLFQRIAQNSPHSLMSKRYTLAVAKNNCTSTIVSSTVHGFPQSALREQICSKELTKIGAYLA